MREALPHHVSEAPFHECRAVISKHPICLDSGRPPPLIAGCPPLDSEGRPTNNINIIQNSNHWCTQTGTSRTLNKRCTVITFMFLADLDLQRLTIDDSRAGSSLLRVCRQEVDLHMGAYLVITPKMLSRTLQECLVEIRKLV